MTIQCSGHGPNQLPNISPSQTSLHLTMRRVRVPCSGDRYYLGNLNFSRHVRRDQLKIKISFDPPSVCPIARSLRHEVSNWHWPRTHLQRHNYSPPYESLTNGRMIVEALRVGTRVEILWDVTKGIRQTNVWWSAANTSIPSRGAISRSATVQYEALKLYKTTYSKVLF
jgi:hypothetical protein